MRITGYPIVFNKNSVDLGGFIEWIRPEAVDRALREKTDVVALWNHNSDRALGRVGANTLALTKDATGLAVSIAVDDEITHARDAIRMIQRGDAVGGSFGFVVLEDSWTLRDGVPFRQVLDMTLREVSVGVVFPAYVGTLLQVSERGVRRVG